MLLIHSFLWLFISFFSCVETVSAAADHCSTCEQTSSENDLIELHVASGKGNFFNVWQLLQTGADVNKKDENGFTALHIAVMNGNEVMVRFLLKHKALSLQDEDARNPLHYAIYYGCTSIVELLADNVESLNEEDIDGNCSLYTAVLYRKYDIIKILLNKGSLVNKKNRFGETALDIAIFYNFDDMVELLLKFGAVTNKIYSSNCARTLFPVDQGILKEYESKSEKVPFSLILSSATPEYTKSLSYTDKVFSSY